MKKELTSCPHMFDVLALQVKTIQRVWVTGDNQLVLIAS